MRVISALQSISTAGLSCSKNNAELILLGSPLGNFHHHSPISEIVASVLSNYNPNHILVGICCDSPAFSSSRCECPAKCIESKGKNGTENQIPIVTDVVASTIRSVKALMTILGDILQALLRAIRGFGFMSSVEQAVEDFDEDAMTNKWNQYAEKIPVGVGEIVLYADKVKPRLDLLDVSSNISAVSVAVAMDSIRTLDLKHIALDMHILNLDLLECGKDILFNAVLEKFQTMQQEEYIDTELCAAMKLHSPPLWKALVEDPTDRMAGKTVQLGEYDIDTKAPIRRFALVPSLLVDGIEARLLQQGYVNMPSALLNKRIGRATSMHKSDSNSEFSTSIKAWQSNLHRYFEKQSQSWWKVPIQSMLDVTIDLGETWLSGKVVPKPKSNKHL